MENGKLVSNVTGGAVYRMATVEDVKAYFDAGFTCVNCDDADYLSYRSSGHAVGDGYSETDGDGNYLNTDAIKILDLVKEYCDTYNVPYSKAKVFVKFGYLEGAMEGSLEHEEAQIKYNVTKIYNHLKTFPCFGGFILRDEPRGNMATNYNAWYRWLVEDLGIYRDGYELHANLLGMNAAEVHVSESGSGSEVMGLTAEQYSAYIQRYAAGLAGAKDEYLTFDYYPFTETITRTRSGTIFNYNYNRETSYSIMGQYFQNLQLFAELSEKNGFARGLCLQSTAFYNKEKYDEINGNGSDSSYTYHGAVNEAMMTYQLYNALAYGYDKIAYFTFMQPFNQTTAEYFTKSPYEWKQQPDGSYKAVATDTYGYVKNANAEIAEIYKRMIGYSWLGTAYSVGVAATGNVFGGTTSYNGGVLTGITSFYDAIAGCLKDENGRYGFMVVNSDDPRLNRGANTITLSFASGYSKVSYIENGVKKTANLTNGTITFNIEAGKGLFVMPEK